MRPIRQRTCGLSKTFRYLTLHMTKSSNHNSLETRLAQDCISLLGQVMYGNVTSCSTLLIWYEFEFQRQNFKFQSGRVSDSLFKICFSPLLAGILKQKLIVLPRFPKSIIWVASIAVSLKVMLEHPQHALSMLGLASFFPTYDRSLWIWQGRVAPFL